MLQVIAPGAGHNYTDHFSSQRLHKHVYQVGQWEGLLPLIAQHWGPGRWPFTPCPGLPPEPSCCYAPPSPASCLACPAATAHTISSQVMASGMTPSTAHHSSEPCVGTYREDLLGLRPHGRCAYTSSPNFGLLEVGGCLRGHAGVRVADACTLWPARWEGA